MSRMILRTVSFETWVGSLVAPAVLAHRCDEERGCCANTILSISDKLNYPFFSALNPSGIVLSMLSGLVNAYGTLRSQICSRRE